MTAAVLSFTPAVEADDREALLAIVTELRALITLDRVEGASPVRNYFVMSPAGKREVAARLKPTGPTPEMYALIAYDFPFARFQFEMAATQITGDRASKPTAWRASCGRRFKTPPSGSPQPSPRWWPQV